MANPEHVAKLKEGVEAWNAWREENREIVSDLQEADLGGAHLQGAYLGGANLQGADLAGANLKGANLVAANLEGAEVGGANLQGADLTGANLQGAHLPGAHLERANLAIANLKGAGLRGAKLQGADLGGANLKGANLERANLEGADVARIRFNRRARYRGIRVSTCYGSPHFKRFAQDQDFLEEFRSVWWRKPMYGLWLIFADCGRHLWPWLGWSIAMAVGYGVKFYSMGEAAFDIRHLSYSLKSMIYYSVVTFTTLGFGDIVPKTHEAASWVMAEVIMGYVMLGGLISIFATKLARRS